MVALIKAVPAFWGLSEVQSVIELHLDTTAAASGLMEQSDKITKLLAKQVPSKVVLAALSETWKKLDNDIPSVSSVQISTKHDRMLRFYELLTRALRRCSRSELLESLRGLFVNFTHAFDLRNERLSEDTTVGPFVASTVNLALNHLGQLEDAVIAAFLELVIKLNETSFQPLFRRFYDWAFGEASCMSFGLSESTS